MCCIQQKSLSGLDNIATEGSSAFQTLHDVAAKLSKPGKITLPIYVLVPVVIAYHVTACATAVYYAVNALEISVLKRYGNIFLFWPIHETF